MNFCLLTLALEKLLIYTRVSRNQMAQHFCLKAQDTHTGGREGERKAERQLCRRKVVADNLLGIQASTIEATEEAPHRYLLVSVEV